MCGIAGFVGDGTREELERMSTAIAHRGPDDHGILIRGSIGLGHQRLSVIDVSPRGHQPMTLNDEDVAIAFNGEIYNFSQLRRELEKAGRKFSSNSDTEVLLHLYALQGDAFLDNVHGMFAIALYDFKKERLLLARDRMGEKPLYWTELGGILRFASELRGLMAAPIKKEISVLALNHYLQSDYVPTPHTIFSDVFKVKPGHILVFEKGKVTEKAFWRLSLPTIYPTEDEAVSKLDVLLKESVTQQLVSDVPVGVFLSGGLDSSTIAHYAARAASKKVHTFAIGFEDSSFDESAYAREVAHYLGTDHHELVMRESDALELIEKVPEVFSEPVADASVIPTLFLSRFAHQSVTVALGGDGGDELFAGYPTFQADSLFRLYRHVPKSLRGLIQRGANALPVSHANFSASYNARKFLSSNEDSATHRHHEWLGTFNGSEREVLLNKQVYPVFSVVDTYANELEGELENKLLYTYMRTYLMDQVLVKVDRASMHFALETRAPFLDHSLVEYALSLPFDFKLRKGTTKYILKRLMHGSLPEGIVKRKKKGFGIPLARWLNGALRELRDEVLSKHELQKHGLFNEVYIQKLVQEHQSLTRDNRKELWNLMVFQMWYRRWMV